MAYMRDVRGKRLDSFDAPRDVVNLLAHFDASTLPGSNGSAVPIWPASFGGFSLNIAPATKPTLLAAALNGKNAVRFGPTAYLRNTDTFGNSASLAAAWAPPITWAFVFRMSSDFAVANGNAQLMGSSAQSIRAATAGGGMYLNAGSDSTTFSPSYADGQWHVGIGIIGTAGAAVYTDGYLTALASTSIGAGALGNIFLGPGLATPPSAGTFDLAEVLVAQTVLTPSRVDLVTQQLAAKWGLS